MSDTNTNASSTKPVAIPLATVAVKRNETELDFVNTVVDRGPAESRGKQYLAPVVNKENLVSTIIPWIGLEETASLLQNLLRKKSAGWYDENMEDDGTFNQQGFVDMAESFSARGESIPELQKQIAELSGQQQDMLNSPTFGTSGIMVDFDGRQVLKEIAEVKEIAKKVIGLQLAIDNKRRLTKEEKAAKEAAEKQAAEAAVAK
jgi:hypothetical protein